MNRKYDFVKKILIIVCLVSIFLFGGCNRLNPIENVDLYGYKSIRIVEELDVCKHEHVLSSDGYLTSCCYSKEKSDDMIYSDEADFSLYLYVNANQVDKIEVLLQETLNNKETTGMNVENLDNSAVKLWLDNESYTPSNKNDENAIVELMKELDNCLPVSYWHEE